MQQNLKAEYNVVTYFDGNLELDVESTFGNISGKEGAEPTIDSDGIISIEFDKPIYFP